MIAAARRAFIFSLLLCAITQTGFQYYVPRSWQAPLQVIVHPVTASDNPQALAYAKSLRAEDFDTVRDWFREQAHRYGGALTPFEFSLGDPITKLPPVAPTISNPLQAAWYSLKVRAYNSWHSPESLRHWLHIHVYYVIHDAQSENLLHSVAFRRGLVAIVQARGSEQKHPQNMVILAHELLHTVGATDKYDILGNPVYPEGFAEPHRAELYPQSKAEISAAHIALTPGYSRLASSLEQTLVGVKTAYEIGW